MTTKGIFMNYKGSCHCGRVAYEVEVEPKTALECNCSICSRKGYLLWFTPRSHLNIIKGEDSLATYTFGHHVIKQVFCPNCAWGPFVAWRRVVKGTRWSYGYVSVVGRLFTTQ